MKVLDTLAADGSGADFSHLGFQMYGHMNLYVAGDLGGGTLTLEAKLPDGSGYVAVQTVNVGMTPIELSPAKCRLTLAGSTTPNVSAWAEFDSTYTQNQARGR